MGDQTAALNRRRLLQSAGVATVLYGTGAGTLLGRPPLPTAGPDNPAAVVARRPGAVSQHLTLRRQHLRIAGQDAWATTVDHGIPGPLIQLYQGHEARLRITNDMQESSSIHWHGLLLPFEMDGVPGVAFPGIEPASTFEARFLVRQYGTYWYHSHSGTQEQSGIYGPLVIHPSDPEPFGYDRDYVVMLSDWTFEDPHRVMARLKKMGDYYNFNRRTLGDFVDDLAEHGLGPALKDRMRWGAMRMSPRDIADVTGHTYTYLMNGLHPEANWTGLFRPGERVRLRFINGSAMSYFNVRLPGLAMTVVQADGQNVAPVEVDELQIAVAETYDVIVHPEPGAYTLFAEAMDRSGYARGTLASRAGLTAPVPALREPPVRTMIDMGMAMPGHTDHGHHGAEGPDQHAGSVTDRHGPDGHGPGNVGIAEVQRSRLAEPGTGLENVDHRVLTYADLRNLVPLPDRRLPGRELEIHLTGNMQRYMWSFDGRKFSDTEAPIRLDYGERLRLILVNDTMMEHPIHLHGMFMELENGQGDHLPYKHTISVKPAERVSLLLTANEPGRWAFHCHLLYHMDAGMFRVVEVACTPATAL